MLALHQTRAPTLSVPLDYFVTHRIDRATAQERVKRLHRHPSAQKLDMHKIFGYGALA